MKLIITELYLDIKSLTAYQTCAKEIKKLILKASGCM